MKHYKLGIFLTFLFAILFITYSFSWMVTEPSRGEIIDYRRDLVVSSAGVTVDVYVYENNDYVLYEEENINVDNMAPNDSKRFKFVVKNSKQTDALVDIIFANIYGDVDILKPYLYFNCSSPAVFSRSLNNDLQTSSTIDGMDVVNYIKFYDDFTVPSHGEEVIYWDIKLDKTANNDVALKSLDIENIMFING